MEDSYTYVMIDNANKKRDNADVMKDNIDVTTNIGKIVHLISDISPMSYLNVR